MSWPKSGAKSLPEGNLKVGGFFFSIHPDFRQCAVILSALIHSQGCIRKYVPRDVSGNTSLTIRIVSVKIPGDDERMANMRW